MEPHLLVVLATLVYGFIGVLVHQLNGFDLFSLAFLRLSFAALALFFAGVYFKKLRVSRNLLANAFVGLTLAIGLPSYFQALRLTTVSTCLVVEYVAPAFAALLSLVFLKENLDRNKTLALALAFLGVLTIGYFQGISLNGGVLYALVTAVCYGSSIFAQRVVGKSGEDPINATLWQSISAVALLSLVTLPSLQLPSSPFQWFILAVLGAVCFALPFGLINAALSKLSSATVGSLLYLEIFFGTLFAWAFLGEVPPVATIVGGVMILSSAYLVSGEK
jgi:drug/metabolite transporter (DMT)-like permease